MSTDHGLVNTPVFMPVGTQASVKALDAKDVTDTGAQIMLANTYHLYLRPGAQVIDAMGGLQKLMRWGKPVLTDSGGFQVFSLGAQLKSKSEAMVPVKITDEGVEFTSHLNGSKHFFTPKKAIEIQQHLGADIIMAFDECTPDNASREETENAMRRTFAWAKICKETWEESQRKSNQGNYQALFGIVQGAGFSDLRRQSAQQIVSLGFDGVALGGETIGYNMTATGQIMDWVCDLLPEDRPRYAMGLGRDPQDILDAIEMGFDMFDCVAPTRLARNGALYCGKMSAGVGGRYVMDSEFPKCRLPIGSAKYIQDHGVIQEGCDCYTCSSGYTRSYLHHLYKAQELSYYRLASIHNTRFMVRLCQTRRELI